MGNYMQTSERSGTSPTRMVISLSFTDECRADYGGTTLWAWQDMSRTGLRPGSSHSPRHGACLT